MKLRVPYSIERSSITVQHETVRIKSFQLIVWLSVASRRLAAWDTRLTRIPAIVDTGNNHNFSISEDQLLRWAGIEATSLPQIGTITERGKRIPLKAASLWLHADTPFRLNLDEGIAVYHHSGPRLPLLGLRVLTNNKLQTVIDGEKRQLTIRTPWRWWPFWK